MGIIWSCFGTIRFRTIEFGQVLGETNSTHSLNKILLIESSFFIVASNTPLDGLPFAWDTSLCCMSNANSATNCKGNTTIMPMWDRKLCKWLVWLTFSSNNSSIENRIYQTKQTHRWNTWTDAMEFSHPRLIYRTRRTTTSALWMVNAHTYISNRQPIVNDDFKSTNTLLSMSKMACEHLWRRQCTLFIFILNFNAIQDRRHNMLDRNVEFR